MKTKFYRKTLKNGMTVLFEKRDVPVVSLALAVRNGAINETSSEKGISHFIEHMMYKGTSKRTAKEIAEEIENNGGVLNGFTGENITAFWCKLPSKKLSIALDVLGDMVQNSVFDKEDIEKERKIIFEEIKMHRDNPSSHIFHESHCLLYKEPFGSPIIGSEKTLKSLTREKIYKKFKQVYQPNNMVLCVVGDADFKTIVNFAEKTFKKSKGTVSKFKVVKKNGTRIEKRKGIDQAHGVLAYHIPTIGDKKNYAAFVLNVLMALGMSSRLFQEIREKRNLAYFIGGQADINKDYAYGIIVFGAPKNKINEIRKLILAEFEKVSKELGEKELSQAKEQVIGHHNISLEDSQNQLVNLLHYEINGKVQEIYNFEKNINAVKLKDVKSLAKIKKHSFFALVPE